MNFWPEKSFTITTQLSPEEVIEKIRNLIEAPRKHDDIYFPFFTHPKKRDYFGVIAENKFRIFIDQDSVRYSKLYERRKKKYNLMISPENRKKDIVAQSNFVEGVAELQNNSTVIHLSSRISFLTKIIFIASPFLSFFIVLLASIKNHTSIGIVFSSISTSYLIVIYAMHKIENIKMKKFLTLFFANALH